jgi:hypothetical protein
MAVDTFYPVAGANSPVDGRVGRNGSASDTFEQVMVGAGTIGNDTSTTMIIGAQVSATFRNISRGIFCFDTSSLPDDAVISAATFNFITAKSNGLGDIDLYLVESTPASTSTIATSDYSNIDRGSGATSFGSITYASVNGDNSTYNAITLNSDGRNYINLTGITSFGVVISWDFNDSYPGSYASNDVSRFTIKTADQSGTASDPYLSVTYTSGGVNTTAFFGMF